MAREQLLNARGGDTMAAERQDALLSGAVEPNNTAIQNLPGNVAASPTTYVLRDAEYIYPLKVGLNTVGRMPDNDVVLPDAYVSRRHCAVLVHAGGRCELHDIASKNGTFLNGNKINGPTRLHSGDQIRMCNRTVVFLKQGDVLEQNPGLHATRTE